MNTKNIFLAALVAIFGLAFTACSDDDTPQAKAVLCEVFQMNFVPEAQSQELRIAADGEWHLVAATDWVTVTPDHGNGAGTVTVSVTANYENGIMQRPRRGEFTVKGGTKLSEFTVVVLQSGDKYLGVPDYVIDELAITPDDTPVVMPDLTVLAITSNNVIVTDGTNRMFIEGVPEGVKVGDKGMFKGYKHTDGVGNCYIDGDEYYFAETAPAAVETPEDVTANFKDFDATGLKYVKVSGHIDNGRLFIEENPESLTFIDSPEGTDFTELQNHTVDVVGYTAGRQGNSVRCYATSIEVTGMYQVVYWREDFEWLEPWSSLTPAGQTIEHNNNDETAQQLGTNKVDGVSTYDALLARGYKFVVCCHESKSARTPQQQAYIQRNYLKFGLTAYYTGIVLPPIENIPEGAHVMLSMDLSSMRQSSGNWDKTDLVLIVKNGEDAVQFEVPNFYSHMVKDAPFEWTNRKMDLGTIKINKDTEITIRNADHQWPSADAGAYRWFVDNIRFYEAEVEE